MQETSFPFEIVIGDDFSTDNTRVLLKGYLERFQDKIRLLFPEKNLGVIPNFAATIAACKGKYIALCEGDDYWTDPLKLQKQVDFLESHPGCMICFHQTLAKYEDEEKEQELRAKFKGNQTFKKEALYTDCIMQTCSVMFRNIHLDTYYKEASRLRIGDWPLFTYLAQFGDAGFIDETMSIYRIHQQGLWNSFGEVGALEVQAEALEFFRDSSLFKTTRGLYDSLFMRYYKLALLHNQRGEERQAGQYLGKCFCLLPKTSFEKVRFFNSLFVQLKLPKVYQFRDQKRIKPKKND